MLTYHARCYVGKETITAQFIAVMLWIIITTNQKQIIHEKSNPYSNQNNWNNKLIHIIHNAQSAIHQIICICCIRTWIVSITGPHDKKYSTSLQALWLLAGAETCGRERGSRGETNALNVDPCIRHINMMCAQRTSY